jgi:hypothetical protein
MKRCRQAHPLAATIAMRSMVDFTLSNARSSRYGHAADHLQSYERLRHRRASRRECPAWKRLSNSELFLKLHLLSISADQAGSLRQAATTAEPWVQVLR